MRDDSRVLRATHVPTEEQRLRGIEHGIVSMGDAKIGIAAIKQPLCRPETPPCFDEQLADLLLIHTGIRSS